MIIKSSSFHNQNDSQKAKKDASFDLVLDPIDDHYSLKTAYNHELSPVDLAYIIISYPGTFGYKVQGASESFRSDIDEEHATHDEVELN